MEKEYIKENAFTLKVVTPVVTPDTSESVYDLDFLKNQELAILKSKNEFVTARDLELLEVRNLLAQAELLGIKSKVQAEIDVQKALNEQNTK